MNTSFGWLLGYREASVFLLEGGNIADAYINLCATKYFVVDIYDYTQHSVNSSLICIDNTDGKTNVNLSSQIQAKINTTLCSKLQTANDLQPFNIATLKDSFPRTMSTASIYASNALLKGKHTKSNHFLRQSFTQHTFAVIPIKRHQYRFGELYSDFGGSLQDNKRVFTGPVTLSRFRVCLLDDNGRLVNLNGANWTIILIADVLYQQHEDTK
jgi:hypothetical protein